MSDHRIRILVVEDQPNILRSQLKLLAQVPDVDVVGTAMSASDALSEARRLGPELVLLDLELPDRSGIEVTRDLKAALPSVEILIFTIFDEEEKVLEAVRAGASGYLLKGATVDRIAEAIREVRGGGTVIQPSLARRLLRHFRIDAPPAKGGATAPPSPLTQREAEILQLIARGRSNAQAAAELQISPATIRTHLEHIYQKLEVTNRVEAVTQGLKKGIIEM
jgi:DNA-binding NarL/FixJ family response regulator